MDKTHRAHIIDGYLSKQAGSEWTVKIKELSTHFIEWEAMVMGGLQGEDDNWGKRWIPPFKQYVGVQLWMSPNTLLCETNYIRHFAITEVVTLVILTSGLKGFVFLIVFGLNVFILEVRSQTEFKTSIKCWNNGYFSSWQMGELNNSSNS